MHTIFFIKCCIEKFFKRILNFEYYYWILVICENLLRILIYIFILFLFQRSRYFRIKFVNFELHSSISNSQFFLILIGYTGHIPCLRSFRFLKRSHCSSGFCVDCTIRHYAYSNVSSTDADCFCCRGIYVNVVLVCSKTIYFFQTTNEVEEMLWQVACIHSICAYFHENLSAQ